jgi:peroxiredoxin
MLDGAMQLEGQTAPDFRLASLDGEEIGLADHRGKVVVLNFFASWCGPCIREMPALQAMS